jgi:dTDP-4-dehydrorhamnose reductase
VLIGDSMKTICITGGNGLLGSKIIAGAHEVYNLISIDLHEDSMNKYKNVKYLQGDIRNKQQIINLITGNNPDFVINAAAYTNVDECETNPEEAWRINVQGAENVALACQSLKIKMIHISTDYIFNGKSGPYSEEDEPNPISCYGKTKFESEKVIKGILDNVVIVRTMVVYGFVRNTKKNFVTWLVDALINKKNIKVVDDQIGTPTLVDDLARILITILENDMRGIYNIAGKECLSRYDFALKVADIFNLDSSLITRTTTKDLMQKAPRPVRSGLKTDKIRGEIGVNVNSICEGLGIVKQQMNEEGFLSK